MEVSACADGLGKDDTSGVESLPDLVEVAASGDLLNEYWCKTLASELLVDGKEVDLRAGNNVLSDTEVNGNGRDKSYEKTGLGCADTNMVFLLPARRHHGPARVSGY